MWSTSASTKAASSRLRKAYPAGSGTMADAAGAGGSACAISGVAMAAVPAAAAPPTTAPLRKSRRSSSCFFMLPPCLRDVDTRTRKVMLLDASMLFLDDPGKAIQIVRRSLPASTPPQLLRHRNLRDELLRKETVRSNRHSPLN